MRRVRSHGKRETIETAVYRPNASAKHLPVRLNIAILGISSGTHTLTVKIILVRVVKSKKAVAVRTLRTSFVIC